MNIICRLTDIITTRKGKLLYSSNLPNILNPTPFFPCEKGGGVVVYELKLAVA